MKHIFAAIAALVIALSVHAQEAGPDALIRSVTAQVLDIVRNDKSIQAGNSQKVMELVDAKVLPYFDFTHMTRLALGRDWRQASPTQQQALTEEFKSLLVRTYSKALSEYRNQSIDYKPLKKTQDGATDVKVSTEIKQPGGQSIQLDYYLARQDKGWKVYDIEVDGISLIANYRNSFAAEISKGGIDGLIQALHEKNTASDVASAKK
jgi:phospholipid transport system substrate-binding protein